MNLEQLQKTVVDEPYWNDELEHIIRQPYDHLASSPGKNFRSELIRIFNLYYKLPEDKISVISRFVEVLHTSSLLIDDVEDSSEWRRGIRASHTVFGAPMTINTANYMYFCAMNELRELASGRNDYVILNKLLLIFDREMMNLHRGQGLDIYWRDQYVVPTEQEYLNMVMNKTGGLFRLTVRIMEVFSPGGNEHRSLVPLSNLLGILYQIKDDYLNLQDATMIQNKGFAEDVSEGKMSFPILHGIRYGAQLNDTVVQDILKLRTHDESLKRKLIAYLDTTSGSLAYTCQRIKEISDLIVQSYLPRDESHATAELHALINHLSTI
ncbi:LAMI_0E07052g1_1 [Lachancea mirantina]|uniref:LAMI_0E07052g1_1 n=1 Tax=Lachancea mirantina TaxID=1230905 RepID=A0A1G4JM84_9SACH|nr:LAMI_0E07052g1_1 [Lachancea mirantina]